MHPNTAPRQIALDAMLALNRPAHAATPKQVPASVTTFSMHIPHLPQSVPTTGTGDMQYSGCSAGLPETIGAVVVAVAVNTWELPDGIGPLAQTSKSEELFTRSTTPGGFAEVKVKGAFGGSQTSRGAESIFPAFHNVKNSTELITVEPSASRAAKPLASDLTFAAPPCVIVKSFGSVAEVPSGFVTTKSHAPGLAAVRLKTAVSILPNVLAVGFVAGIDWPPQFSATVAPA